jgi:phosphatidyl-myo-inositol dimannoside synthase
MVTPDYPPAHGGIQHVAARLAEHLDADVRVVTLDRGAHAAGEPGVRRTRALRPSGPAAVAALNVMAIREGLAVRPDVILSLHIVAGPSAFALSRLLRRPWVQWVHAKELPEQPAVARVTLRNATAVVAVSRYSRSLALALGADPSRVRIVAPGIDVRDGASAPRRRQVPTVLTISRLVERYKGHDVLARAMPLVRARVPGAEWVIVGDGPLRRDIEAMARRTPAGARFVGAVGDTERDRWLDGAHVFAMPSRVPAGGYAGEGFGIVFLEAGLHELPVVAGDVGGACDAVIHGRTGLLVDPNNHVALAGALSDLLEDHERAARMGRAGAAHAREHAWPDVAARVRTVLGEVACAA